MSNNIESNQELKILKESEKDVNFVYGVKKEPLSAKWKKPTKNMLFIQRLFAEGMTPKEVLATLLPNEAFPAQMTDEFALQIILELCKENLSREKLPQYSTFTDAVELFKKSKNILVLTGAGISVSCGIPDFRSANGIYARLHYDFPELPDPTAMFDMDFFRKNPVPFYNFAREIFPGQFKPSLSHMFIKFLEKENKLLRNYTQNIDTLEKVAGIERVCKECKIGIIKPNIVFFGEDLNDEFHIQMGDDQENVDLLVVIGSSLKVHPVALIPFNMSPNVPQILINREQLTRYKADIKLLGNCDDILVHLAMAIGGSIQQKMPEHKTLYDSLQAKFLQENKTCNAGEPILPTILNVEDFKQIINKDDCTEPEPKKRNIESDDRKAMDPLWESNYVSVETVLASDSTLLVPPNLQIFKGGVLFYERDNDTFCRQVGSYYNKIYECDEEEHHPTSDYKHHESSSSESFSSTSTGSEDDDIKSFNSLPAELLEFEESKSPQMKQRSCSPTIIRERKVNPAVEFLNGLKNDSSEEWKPPT